MDAPRLINTIDEYVPLLIRSGLVSEGEVAKLLSEYRSQYLPTQRLPDTITAWCAFLVGAGSISPWQSERLRHGQWKGFVFEGYTLLDRLGSDDSHSFYFARSVATNALVRLSICAPQPGRSPRFSVDHEYP